VRENINKLDTWD